MSDRLIPLGKLVSTHGIRGWLKLKTANLQSPVLDSTREIVLEKGGVRSHYFLQLSKPHKDHVLVQLKGIDGIDVAKNLVGSTLLVDEETLQPPGPGEYYYYQALGLNVFDTRGVWIGKVTRIWFKKGGDLYVVSGASREYLIPAIREVVEKIDIPGEKMIINPPDGLLDI